ncbi:MAG: MurR/RpiR family transcriptional regulator [Clostridiales bacterium]|nr:MurR/RpiR family transcriptional regulator [Clostridiales bacterium]
MAGRQDLIHRINACYKGMSKGQKLISEYIINNYDKAAFMTASKLGGNVGVSESTVVRFANMLGYEGYPKLQKALQELIRTKLTTVQRIEMSSELDQGMILKNVLKADMNNIRKTIEEASNEVFNYVVDSILKAKNIYVMGLRSSAPLAQFMGYYLSFIFSNVRIVTSGVNDVFEQLIHISNKDLLIGISFPRYATRTIEAMAFAKERKATTVALTDGLISPLTPHSDYILQARSDVASFVDSLVAPLSLINALIVGVGMKKSPHLASDFLELEQMWGKYNVYVGRDKS